MEVRKSLAFQKDQASLKGIVQSRNFGFAQHNTSKVKRDEKLLNNLMFKPHQNSTMLADDLQ